MKQFNRVLYGVILIILTSCLEVNRFPLDTSSPSGLINGMLIAIFGSRYQISGSINNLTASGLILQNNGIDPVTILSSEASFSFAATYLVGTSYSVEVSTPPSGQYCTVTNGVGVITADVTNITLDCYTSGSFDTSFGSGTGYSQLNDIAGLANSAEEGKGIFFDLAGKVYAGISTQNGASQSVAAICRFNEDGSLDTSYASTSSFPGCALSAGNYFPNGFTIDLATGQTYTVGVTITNTQYISRFNTDGTVDTSFGTSGYTPFLSNEAWDIVLDSFTRPIVVGRANCGATCDWTIARFTNGGVLDTSFNGTGTSVLAGGYGTAFSVGIDNNGKIVAAGGGAFPTQTMTVKRYNIDGSLDTSFNGTGNYSFPLGSYLQPGAGGVTFDSVGNILVAGGVGIDHSASPNYNDDMAFWRLTPDGVLDATLNGTGYVTHANAALATVDPVDEAVTAVVDKFGRIILAGASRNPSGFDPSAGAYKNSSVVVWRYLNDGTPDTSFNSGSHFKIVDTQIFHQNQYAGKIAMKLDPIGRIVIVGHKDPDFEPGGDYSVFKIWRLWN